VFSCNDIGKIVTKTELLAGATRLLTLWINLTEDVTVSIYIHSVNWKILET
jgi:hypothetical protein